ncbi:ribulose-phosphate 3-epimerase [Lagierella massiliensis]|uniref:ribulose-phosphate 3-epimerase n=1 Tax=Lagierella massiliensis TaxID=1689303 RepID=UPI0006D8068B|nr:ribulose-phosphate 3-epimerase [Lagierella massiliensis]
MSFLSPSLLSANFYNLSEQLDILVENDVKYLHLDVMDGNFVPNISFGPGIIKSLRKKYDFIFDTHLMIVNPENYIENFKDAGCDIVTIHYEATKHPLRVLQQIRQMGMKAGISLNPGTPVEVLDYLWDELDLILIMTVNPGFGGQSFIESQLKKIKRIRELINKNNPEILLEIDGGVKTTNIESLLDLDIDLFVSGSDVFNEDIYLMQAKLDKYKEILRRI